MTKVYLITGASSGLGLALAEAALAHGERVVLAARRTESLAALRAAHPDACRVVRADVTKDDDRRQLVAAAETAFGGIDVLVNNAGRGSLGAAEEFGLDQLRDQLELNFVACAALIREVLPGMRARRSGHIINVSSIGGRVNVGGFSAYGAAKFALEGYSEALHAEVGPLGIRVTVVEPGALRTEFAGDANLRPERQIADYEPILAPIRAYLYGSSGKQLGDPRKVAGVILRLVASPQPPLRILLGADAYALWDAKKQENEAEMARWRPIGIDTAYAGETVRAIGQG
ncbi:MAG: oxidoreductase [Opitutaceae bacterium]